MANSVSQPIEHNWYPPWAPRFWNGMCLSSYWQLLRENRFDIDLTRYPMAFLVGGCAGVNTFLSAIQRLTHGRKIDQTVITEPPIFVIGHWRSGTTLMHELLTLDQRFGFPSNFEAFVPSHFLLSRLFLYPIVKLLMPSSRPMDNMEMRIASPQEDDFALCAFGAPTPYRRIAFPNRPHNDHRLLNIENANPAELDELQQAMQHFFKMLSLRYQGKRLMLKSPPHTGRIKKLAEWFPHAKFIHISRHPYDLVPSTMRLWKSLDQLMGFQVPRYDDTELKNYIFECQELMYAAYFQQSVDLPANDLVEVRYEDLTAAPLDEMERVYTRLELGGFQSVRESVENYFDRKKGHQKNRFSIDERLRVEIDSRWSNYLDRFGYR